MDGTTTRVPCRDCAGTNTFDCPFCQHRGVVDCKVCAGKGRLPFEGSVLPDISYETRKHVAMEMLEQVKQGKKIMTKTQWPYGHIPEFSIAAFHNNVWEALDHLNELAQALAPYHILKDQLASLKKQGHDLPEYDHVLSYMHLGDACLDDLQTAWELLVKIQAEVKAFQDLLEK